MYECGLPTQNASHPTPSEEVNALKAEFELQLCQRDQQIAELSAQLEEERRQRESLQQILAEKEARARVETWIAQGKLVPAQREAAVYLLMVGGEIATTFEQIIEQNLPQLLGESLKGTTLPADRGHLIQTYIQEWGMDEETATLAAENYLSRYAGFSTPRNNGR